MNVLFLDSIEESIYGGMEEWIRLNGDGLASRGHNVSVAGRPGSSFLKRVGATTTGVETIPIALSGDFHPAAIASIKEIIKSRQIDIISANFNRDVRLAGLAAKLAGSPPLVWSVGLDITSDKAIHRLLTPRLIDAVITPSEALKNQICSRGYIALESVEVIPIGIEPLTPPIDRTEARSYLQTRYGVSGTDIVAVTSGRLVEQKGHRYLVDAAAQLTDQCPDLKFLLLGDGELESDLRNQIAAHKLEDRFLFAGMLADTSSELAGADLMVHPSIEEPFGIVLAEGMRASLPIIASQVGGIPEVVFDGETAILVDAKDSASLAKAIVKLVSDVSLRQSMGEAGYRRYREQFSASIMIDRVEKFFATRIEAGRVHGAT